MIKWSIHQEYITITSNCIRINMHLTTEPPKHKQQKLTEEKAKIDHSTIMVGEDNTSLFITDGTTRQKVSNKTGMNRLL